MKCRFSQNPWMAWAMLVGSGCLAAQGLAAQDKAPQDAAAAARAKRDRAIEALRAGAPREQWRALRRLVAMGEAAVPALQRLIQRHRGAKPDTGAWLAAEALQRLGPRAVSCLPAVVELLEKGTPGQQLVAVRVLQGVGPFDPDSSVRYCDLLYAHRTALRRNNRLLPSDPIVSCMVRLSEPTEPDDVPGWIAHVRGASAAHREMGIERLLLLGEKARPAVAAVRDVLTGKDLTRTTFRFRGTNWGWGGSQSCRDAGPTRLKAAEFLTAMGATKDVQKEVDLALLTHGDPAVRQRSVLSLGALGEAADRHVVQALVRTTRDADKLTAWDAITALGMLGSRASAALPTLEKLAAGNDKARAARAKAAIRQIERPH